MDPRTAIAQAETDARLPGGKGDRLTGYAVYALPFASGDVLALRRFPASSFGPAYTAVWHRDPDGRWRHFADQAAEVTCPRFFGSAFHESHQAGITIEWDGPSSFEVRVGDDIVWNVTLRPTFATRAMSFMGRTMPEAWSRNPALLAPMSRMARPMLRSGRIRLSGRVPNGQWFRASPVAMWRVASSRARVGDRTLDRPQPLAVQEHLRDFWLLQRGLFGTVRLSFEPYDRRRHKAAAPTAGASAPPTRVAADG